MQFSTKRGEMNAQGQEFCPVHISLYLRTFFKLPPYVINPYATGVTEYAQNCL